MCGWQLVWKREEVWWTVTDVASWGARLVRVNQRKRSTDNNCPTVRLPHSIRLPSRRTLFWVAFATFLIFSSSRACSSNQKKTREEMALQIPVTTRTTKANATSSWPTPALAPNGNPGLRCLSNRLALRSSSFIPSLNLLLPPTHRQQSSAYVPRFSMRLASKQAYICRDCGYRFYFWVE